jgi:O-antigen ligase
VAVTTYQVAPEGTALQTVGVWLERLAFGVFLGVVVFAPVAQGSVYPWSQFGLRAGVVGTLVLWLVSAALRGHLRLPPLVLWVPLVAYLGLVGLSAWHSVYQYGSWQEALNVLIYVSGFFLAAALLRTQARRAWLLASFGVAAVVMGVYGLAQLQGYRLVPSVVSAGKVQVTSFYYHYSHYAGFLDLAAPLFLGLALLARAWWARVGLGLVAGLLYLNAALTFSYAGWGAVFVATAGMLVVWVFHGATRSWLTFLSRFVFMLLLAAAGAGLAYTVVQTSPRLSGATFNERVQQLLGEQQEVNGDVVWAGQGLGRFGSRIAILRAGLPIVKAHPWLGLGPGNFIYGVTEFRPGTVKAPHSGMMHAFVNYAHNDYLQVASETGLPSLAAFLLFWLLVLFRSPRGVPLGVRFGITAGLAAILVHGLMDGNLTVNSASAFLAYVLAGTLHASAEAGGEEQGRTSLLM